MSLGETKLEDMTKTNKAHKVVSLFSGCGGLDLGLHGGFKFLGQTYERNPLEVVYANDINKAATETFKLNFPGVRVENEDITKVLEGASSIPNSADLVVGGFPCQDFSLAGKRQGLNVQRGQLYLSMVETVKRTQPKIFLAENVKGLLLWEKGLAIETIKADFAEIGYRVDHKLLNTADFGVPETRERVIIVGVRSDVKTDFAWPSPTHSKDGSDGLKPWVTLKQALGDLEDDEFHFSLPNSGYSKAKRFPGTQGNSITSPDKPGPTMRAEHHGNIEFHYSGQRRLSAREAARIQSFPDDFIFHKSTTDAYRQVGNAVAPVFGWHLAQSVIQVLES
jgi:DNA (cytosine-5)-methyltransferase 1